MCYAVDDADIQRRRLQQNELKEHQAHHCQNVLLLLWVVCYAVVVDDADVLRRRLQQSMQQEHQATSAVRAANRRAEAQLTQARQVRSESLRASYHHWQLKPL